MLVFCTFPMFLHFYVAVSMKSINSTINNFPSSLTDNTFKSDTCARIQKCNSYKIKLFPRLQYWSSIQTSCITTAIKLTTACRLFYYQLIHARGKRCKVQMQIDARAGKNQNRVFFIRSTFLYFCINNNTIRDNKDWEQISNMSKSQYKIGKDKDMTKTDMTNPNYN